MKNFEYLRISIYNENPDFTAGSDCHYKTHKILLPYSDILAICTKKASCDDKYRNTKRGGALIYVIGREDPYVTSDKDSFAQIISKINRNPFGCCSGLTPVGQSVYAIAYQVIDNQTILLDGTTVYLYITKNANVKRKKVNNILEKIKNNILSLLNL